MTRSSLIIIALFALLLLPVGCRKDTVVSDEQQEQKQEQQQKKYPVTFAFQKSSGLKSVSITDATVIHDDPSGFTVAGITSTSHTLYFNTNAMWNEEQSCFTTSMTTYFPVGNPPEGMDFFAVYPPRTIKVEGSVVSFPDCTISGTEDIVSAVKYNVPPQEESVPLAFSHLLSRLSVNVFVDEDDFRYELLETKVEYPSKATFRYDNTYKHGIWELTDDTPTTVVQTSPAVEVTATKASPLEIFEDRAILPGKVTITLSWKVYQKSTGMLVGDYTHNADILLTNADQGKINEVNCKLSNADASELTFEISIKEWKTITVTPNIE